MSAIQCLRWVVHHVILGDRWGSGVNGTKGRRTCHEQQLGALALPGLYRNDFARVFPDLSNSDLSNSDPHRPGPYNRYNTIVGKEHRHLTITRGYQRGLLA